MAVFFQVAGTQLALPDYARIDLAYIDQLLPASPPPDTQFLLPVPGDRIYVPVGVVMTFTTDGTVAARTVFYTTEDSAAHNLALTFSPTPQPASTSVIYAFNVGLATGYTTAATLTAIPLPVSAIMATQILNLSALGFQAGDRITQIAITVVAIPTGPLIAATTETVATPVLA